MIDVRELMIGNWVLRSTEFTHPNGSTNEYREYEIHMPELISHCRANNRQYKPIPLTPEWLERFSIDGGAGFFKKEVVGIVMDGDMFYLAVRDVPGLLFQRIRKIEYVHQLQNVYHALKGKELELKPLDQA